MQIHRLALKNFKCFKEVDISFSKITLLTGENSSGKSSLIYGILAPLQSINLNSNSFPLYLSLNGDYVSMGGFQEVSFNHNLKNYIDISLTFSEDKNAYNFNTSWEFDTLTKSHRLNHLDMSYYRGKAEVNQNQDLSYIVNIESKNIIDLHIQSIDALSSDENWQDNYFACAILDLYSDFNIHNNFNFISPFRLSPERTYYKSISNKIDKFGDGYIDQIIKWNDNFTGTAFAFTSILKNLNILYDIKAQKLPGGRFDIKVKVKSRSKWESLADVGFGTSQFLPIIVADLQLSDHSTLIISQPEAHLHPSVQANLGNYLVKQVKEKNKNYIVETHSEYLLNRMRLLIVKGEIQPEDVAVYYFENSIKDGSIAHRLEFTKNGQILNAPKGFFETYMIDTMDIALNA